MLEEGKKRSSFTTRCLLSVVSMQLIITLSVEVNGKYCEHTIYQSYSICSNLLSVW